MRLWSISFKYLDSKGLVALWREALLAQNVLLGKTKGYRNHPQLERFKNCSDPIASISNYLIEIYLESYQRGFNFNYTKILNDPYHGDLIKTSSGQLIYEFEHLQNKLILRDKYQYDQNELKIKHCGIESMHLIDFYEGPMENWEKINPSIK